MSLVQIDMKVLPQATSQSSPEFLSPSLTTFSIKITAGKKCSLWARCSPVREKCVQEPRNTRSFFLIVPKKNGE